MAINSTLISTQAIAQSVGLLGASRTGATASDRYRNGIAFGTTSTAASSAVVGAEVYVLARNGNGVASVFSSRQLSLILIGAGLSAAEHLALFNIIEPYMDAIGAGVV